MIGYLCGKIVQKDESRIILDVGGVGYLVYLSSNSLAALPQNGQEAKIFTFLQLRDDSMQMFGFVTIDEKEMFENLISINKVGPKLAIAVLSSFGAEELKKAFATEDIELLSSIPGIGRKTAQRLVLELKEKMALPDLKPIADQPDNVESPVKQIREALKSLGYSSAEISAAMENISYDADNFEQYLKETLKYLGSHN